MKAADIADAAKLHREDFENAAQSVTAARTGTDHIITGNIRDFTKTRFTAFTPAELIAGITRWPQKI